MDPGLSHSTIPLRPVVTAVNPWLHSKISPAAGWQSGVAVLQVQTVRALMSY